MKNSIMTIGKDLLNIFLKVNAAVDVECFVHFAWYRKIYRGLIITKLVIVAPLFQEIFEKQSVDLDEVMAHFKEGFVVGAEAFGYTQTAIDLLWEEAEPVARGFFQRQM